MTNQPIAERDDERGDGQNREQPVDDDQVRVAQQVGGKALLAGGIRGEEPADVGPQEPAGGRGGLGSVADRRMGVARAVAEHVVTAMCRHPTDHRSLERHGPGHGQHDLEGPVRQKLRWAKSRWNPALDPETGEDVEHRGQPQAPDGRGATPTEREEDGECHQRPRHEQRRHDAGRGQGTRRSAARARLRWGGGGPRHGRPLENDLRHGVHFLPARRGGELHR